MSVEETIIKVRERLEDVIISAYNDDITLGEYEKLTNSYLSALQVFYESMLRHDYGKYVKLLTNAIAHQEDFLNNPHEYLCRQKLIIDKKGGMNV